MRLLCILFSLMLLLSVVTSLRMDAKRRIQIMYKMSESSSSSSRNGGVKGGSATQRPLRKGEYVCGNDICKLRPGEVPKGCEDGECQYNIL